MQCCAKVLRFNLMATGATVTGKQPITTCRLGGREGRPDGWDQNSELSQQDNLDGGFQTGAERKMERLYNCHPNGHQDLN